MKVLPNTWKTYGRTLYLDEYDTLIVSDIHLGKCISQKDDIEDKYNKKYNRLNNVVIKTNPTRLILCGDIFYCSSNYFENQINEDKHALNILYNLKSNVDELILLGGNHELVLGGFTDEIKSNFNVKNYYIINDILIQHGHDLEQPNEDINHHIIGHVHPTKDGKAAFHYCKNGYNNCSVTILPSFCEYVDTVNINYYSGICPILQKGTDAENYTTKFV